MNRLRDGKLHAHGTFAFARNCVVKRAGSARSELSHNLNSGGLTTEATSEQIAKSERVELVVPALHRPIRFHIVAATVQQN